MTGVVSSNTRKRSVFYIPGLDPSGAARNHYFLHREARRHNERPKDQIEIDTPTLKDRHFICWPISQRVGAEKETLEYYFFDWSDIVSDFLTQSIISTLIGLCRSWKVLSRLFQNFDMRNGRPYAIVTIYSLFLVFCYFALAIGGSALAIAALWPRLGPVASVAIPSIVGVLIIRSTLLLEPRLFAYFFLRTLNFSQAFADQLPAELSNRLDRTASTIWGRIDKGDEVILVGHSYGALLTAPIIERLLQKAGTNFETLKDRLIVINMGSLHPLLTLDPNPNWYHRSILAMASSGIRWIEVFSGYDALNFPHYNPASSTREGKAAAPAFRDVNFFERCRVSLFSPGRFRVFQNHFRYLMAEDDCCPYDYFDYLFAEEIERYWNPPPPPEAS